MAMKKRRAKKTPVKAPLRTAPSAADPSAAPFPPALREFLKQTATPKGFVNRKPLSADDLRGLLES